MPRARRGRFGDTPNGQGFHHPPELELRALLRTSRCESNHQTDSNINKEELTPFLPLDALFILAAAQSANEGAECAGEDYREREVEDASRVLEAKRQDAASTGSAASVEGSAAAEGANPPSEPDGDDQRAENVGHAVEHSHS